MSLFAELKKRKVFTTAVIYLPGAWLVAEILIFLSERMGAGEWAGDVIAVLLVLGFPVALLLSWTFDVTPQGVKRASPGTPLGIIVLLTSGLFLSTSTYVAYQVFSGRASEVSVVILPLRTDPGTPDAQPYGLGIADSLRTALQQMPLFRVPARTSSEAVASAGLDIPDIAEKLDVQYILEGSLQMMGSNLDVSVALVDEGGDVRWTERFQRATRDIFDLQNDLVRAVALELGLDESDAGLQQHIRKPAPTQDMEAHRLFLQGKYVQVDPMVSMKDSEAMDALKAARQRDPGYAAVYQAIAFLYAFDCWLLRDRRSPSCELAVSHARQSLQIDPEQAEALAILAVVHAIRYEYRDAQSAIDRYLTLADQGPNFPAIPWAYLHLGRLQLAWDSAQAYYRDDPLNVFGIANMVLWGAVLKKDLELAETYEKVLLEMLDFSILQGYPPTRRHRVDMQTAVHDLREVLPIWGISPELAEVWVEPLYDPSMRQGALAELEVLYSNGDIPEAAYWKTLIVLFETDRALDLAFNQYDGGILEPVEFWLDLPGGKEFRSHPRFVELLEYIGLAAYWDQVGWPPFCEIRGDERFCGLDWAVD